jgi:hypothetical protein
MALALVTPTGGVTSFASGLIAVRLQDYPGPARGTLSVVTDALSVGGDVIKEEQELAVPTTLTGTNVTNQISSAADSVRIPLADLGLRAGQFYHVFITIRTEGDPPATALYQSTWDRYGGASGTPKAGSGTVAFGDSNSANFGDVGAFARKHVPNYVMHYMGLWSRNLVSPPTNLTVRAWGITGGDQAIYLDMLYLLPRGKASAGTDPGWGVNDISLDYGYDPTFFVSDDSVDPDQDNDATSAPWLGQFSVLKWENAFIPEGRVDMQEDDDEATAWHHNEGAWEIAPRQHLAYIVGTTLLEAVTIIEEDFPTFTQGTNWDVGLATCEYITDEGYVVVMQHGNVFGGNYQFVDGVDQGFDPGEVVQNGWQPFDGSQFLRCFIPDGEPGGNNAYVFPGGGQFATLLGDSSSDPRDCKPLAWMIDGGVMTGRFRWLNSINDVWAGIGMTNNLVTGFCSVQAELQLRASGDLELSLNQDGGDPHGQSGGTAFNTAVIDGPVTVGTGYTLGDEWWLKVEKRGYFWRAKAWADGDTEPDWQVEGHEFMWRRNTGPVPALVAYPYDTNWGAAAGTTMFYDPRDASGQRKPHVRATAGVNSGAGDQRVKLDLLYYKLEHDPGAGTPGDVETKVLRYDDSSVLDSTVAVPYGSHRWVYGPLLKRRFGGTDDFDDLGFNIRVWKDSSFPDLTPALLGGIWERRVFASPFLPQIYRLVRY